MRRFLPLILIALAIGMPLSAQRWSEAKANAWYEKQPWLVGANYNPASAINQLEMWQAEWIHWILFTLAVDNPVHKCKQVLSHATGTEACSFLVFSMVQFQVFQKLSQIGTNAA